MTSRASEQYWFDGEFARALKWRSQFLHPRRLCRPEFSMKRAFTFDIVAGDSWLGGLQAFMVQQPVPGKELLRAMRGAAFVILEVMAVTTLTVQNRSVTPRWEVQLLEDRSQRCSSVKLRL